MVRRRRLGVPAAGALLRRWRHQALRRRARTGCGRETSSDLHHVDGLSPAWPLTYDDFEPYYTRAEWLYQVHGNHGEDPTEGHWSKQYPWPAVSHEERIEQLFGDLQSAGYHPFHAPCGVLLDEAEQARSNCIRCTWCDGYPCLVHAKSDAETIAVRPILDLPNVTLLVNAEVTRLRTDATGGTVTGVDVTRGGAEEVYDADVVVVSAGAANSAKLLLRSASDRHPNGLANGSDQVGRNYMFHNCKAVVAIAKELNETTFQKTLGINDFYFATDDYQWPAGNVQMVGKSNAEAMKGEEPKLTMLAPHFSLSDVAEHAVDFWLTTEDLPKPENRVTLDGDAQRAPRLPLHERRRSRSPLRGAEAHPEPRRLRASTTCSGRTSTWT